MIKKYVKKCKHVTSKYVLLKNISVPPAAFFSLSKQIFAS